MISLAGVPLAYASPDLLALVVAYLDPAEVWDWVASGPTFRQRGLGWRAHRPACVRPGVLVWPTGACRWAHAHYLASREATEALTAAARQASYGPLALLLDDGQRSLTVSMYLLPPRPLYDVPGAGGTYLLTLVDDRWRWWHTAADVVANAGVTTWEELYEALAEALDVDLDAEAIDPAFLSPPVGLASRYEALPPLLDAVAASVGHKVVVDSDGTVHSLDATASRTRETANLLLLPRLAGGETYRE